jgi:hypothetical protein
MRVFYDESHNQTWTIDPAAALSLSLRTNEAPRYYSYAHLVELIRSRFGGTCTRLTQGPIDAEALAGVDVLVLNHFCAPSHRHLGIGGSGRLSAEEIAALKAAVEGGMGLLVLGEFDTDSWGNNVNELLGVLGLRFNNDTATVEAAAVRGPQRLTVFETDGVAEHPAAAGVARVSYCSGCTVSLLAEDGAALLSTAEGQVLAAGREVGRAGWWRWGIRTSSPSRSSATTTMRFCSPGSWSGRGTGRPRTPSRARIPRSAPLTTWWPRAWRATRSRKRAR